MNKINDIKLLKIHGFKFDLLYFLIFCIFQFPIMLSDYSFICYTVYYFVPIIYLLFHYKLIINLAKNILNNKLYRKFLVFISMFILITLLFPIIFKTNDFSALLNEPFLILKKLIMNLFLLVLYINKFKECVDFDGFANYYILACSAYVIFTIGLIIFPDLKLFLYNILKEDARAKSSALDPQYLTRYGWSGFSAYGQSFKMSIGVALSSFLILRKENTFKFSYYIILFINLLGASFYGRTGMIISFFVILILIYKLSKSNKQIFKIIISVIFLLFLFLVIGYFISDNIKIWMNWSFDFVKNAINGEAFSEGSLGVLVNRMIFLPDIKTILIGDALYTDKWGQYYMLTDIGYMRTILFGGIPYFLARYGLILAFISTLKVQMKRYININYLLISILIIVLFFELKGEIIGESIALLLPYLIINVMKDSDISQ